MSLIARMLFLAAVALSPTPHRELRREQWASDIAGAHELGLSSTALAFGAFTTALFHRRSIHRSTWGNLVPVSPIDASAAPHTIRTVPVLILTATTAVFGSGVWLIMQPNYGYASAVDSWIGKAGFWTLFYFVPAVAIVGAILVLRTGTPARRRLGASLVAAGALGGVFYPYVFQQMDVLLWLLPTVLGLAGWFVATGLRDWRWLGLAAPVLMFVAIAAGLLNAVPGRLAPFVTEAPSFASILVGVFVTRSRMRPVPTPPDAARDSMSVG